MTLIYFADFIAVESRLDEAVELLHGDAVLGKHVAVGTHLELRRLGLLLDTDVNKSFNAVYGRFNLTADGVEPTEVGAEDFDGDGGLGTADHVVDTVA